MNKVKIQDYLLENNLALNIEEAKLLISCKLVYLKDKLLGFNDIVIEDDFKNIRLLKHKTYVSRGYIKLESVFEKHDINVNNLVCLDIGSSTGGFTQVLLSKNAQKVYCVDVGANLLDNKIKNNPKVEVCESINARYLSKYAKQIKDIDFCTIDVSFISIKKIVPELINILKNDAYFVPLIKPQFECSKDKLLKGVVKDPTAVNDLKNEMKAYLSKNFNILDIIDSKIKGAKGNQEFFILSRKKYELN